ncbi:2-hydroxychromene-2-carboxylate isomerase [Metapseudomonas furukawaii]|uniref:2-hydroxychromene-2-carboxylate isomerase n=1 Tax=Metapseudomonas furukawaii TaxID=1149133 RepID=A0AAD1BVS2_METFU|nr:MULTISPECIES: 2-hydroxychromene-2-carboxylate isomerase [Pseudomonas]ELS27629.1 2-hydroxychromene-2-carboxylate isomerase family protein, glutathione-dependent [Pseudomonas furukawaii]OWJ90633.1 disulfide bond formation protein DsbA [Pseudomonas sp. A46]BAU71811.1 2-hydroxychromene-2-carboxylate isomerase family protein [Pseudomonas furukawaii]
MTKTLEFYFDLGSPASYLAWTQLPGICARQSAELRYRPMLLGGVFQATGNASPAAVPAKARHSMIDLQRFARRYGVPMHFNPYFPINTLTLMRGAIGLQLRQPERFEAYLEAMFRALWENKRNLGDPAVLAATLQDAGFDPQALLSLASDQAVKDALKSATEEAVRRGVFGAPTCFVGDEMFFGQDRLDFVEEALA